MPTLSMTRERLSIIAHALTTGVAPLVGLGEKT